MKIEEFAKFAMERDPKGLGKLPEKKALAAVRAVLRAISAHIDEAADGTAVKVPVLGTFRVALKEGKDGAPAKRRVGFRRAKAKAGAAGKGKGAAGKAARRAAGDKPAGKAADAKSRT
jgi:nucleoid DNA-binding protein